jgi:hypothetical protein
MPVNIAEFTNLDSAFGSNGLMAKLPPHVTPQNVSIGANSTAMNAKTRVIRAMATESLKVDGVLLAAGVPEYFAVTGGQVIAVSAA